MKGFLQEYGIIMVVVAVVLGMLAFGKTGYAKGIQNAILGSTNHIVETGENIVPKPVKASDIIEIEGTKYIVLEKRGNYQALVMTASSIGKKQFLDNGSNYDENFKKNWNTYEGNTIDKYLENTWYKGLSAKMQNAIQIANIKQLCYYTKNVDSPPRDNYNGEVYNTISRHVFLPSVSEIGNILDLKNPVKINAFLNSKEDIWLRDSEYAYISEVIILTQYNGSGRLSYLYATNYNDMRPTFVIDLSKVDYTEAGHTDYK